MFCTGYTFISWQMYNSKNLSPFLSLCHVDYFFYCVEALKRCVIPFISSQDFFPCNWNHFQKILAYMLFPHYSSFPHILTFCYHMYFIFVSFFLIYHFILSYFLLSWPTYKKLNFDTWEERWIMITGSIHFPANPLNSYFLMT